MNSEIYQKMMCVLISWEIEQVLGLYLFLAVGFAQELELKEVEPDSATVGFSVRILHNFLTNILL